MTQECTPACLTPPLNISPRLNFLQATALASPLATLYPPVSIFLVKGAVFAYYIDIFKSAIADIDECAENETNECDINANCTNTEGSYNCACRIGFRGNGKNCTGTKWVVSKAYQRAVVSIAFSLKGR